MEYLSTKGLVIGATLVFLISIAAVSLYQQNQNEDELPENIVYISLDAVSAEHIGCYGHHRDTAPNICGLENSTLYENAYATSSWSIQSLVSMQTGVYHHRTNVVNENTPMNESYHTIAELLDEKGYRTVLRSQNYFMNRGINSDRGFDDFAVNRKNFQKKFRQELESDNLYFRVHIMASHDPYDPSMHHYNYTDYQYIEQVNDTLALPRDMIKNESYNISAEERQKMIDQYDENIRAADHYVGRLIDKLKEKGEYKDSLIIVNADHGEAFNNYGDGIWLHENPHPPVARIPMVVKYPDQEEKMRSSKLVSHMDPFKIVMNEIDREVDYNLDSIDPRSGKRKRHFTYDKHTGFGITNRTHFAFYNEFGYWRYYQIETPKAKQIQKELTGLKQKLDDFRTKVEAKEYNETLDLREKGELWKRLQEMGYLN